jgi:type IX secretion system PorP/SprF family membrane protein
MKKLLILAVLITMGSLLKGQYSPQVSHFMYDHLRTNPGSAGSTDMISATGIYRNQFIGFEGAPQSYFLEVDAPFKLLGAQHGVGVTIFNDVIGNNNDISPALSYALRISVGDGSLGIGIQAGVIQSKIKSNWVTPNDDVTADQYIPSGDADGTPLNLAAGLFYRNEDIYFGASVINLNSPKISAPSESINGTAEYNLSRQYYVTAGYNMQLSNPVYEIKPAVLLKSDGVATDMDLNLTLAYNKKIWGGVSYRTGSAIIGLIGLELIENLKVGFSYDFATSALSKESSGTIEVVMSYSFKIGVEKAPQKYKSIRFL